MTIAGRVPGEERVKVWERVVMGGNPYWQSKWQFPYGHFHLRLFSNGTVQVFVDVAPPGLDAKGLADLWGYISAAVYAEIGEHVTMDMAEVKDLREINFDTKDPDARQLLHLSGVKSGMAYSSLLESYLRIYAKSGDTVRLEAGGKNAFELMRGLMRPLSVQEQMARMPSELLSAFNQARDQLSERIDVLSQGMANIHQQRQHDHELMAQLTSVVTVLIEKLTGFIDKMEKDWESRRQHEAKLSDTIEVLLCEHEINQRLSGG